MGETKPEFLRSTEKEKENKVTRNTVCRWA